MSSIIVAFLLLVATSPVLAQTPRIDRIDLVEFGIYEGQVARKIEDPNLATGSRSILTGIRRKEATSTIPARMGLKFGFHYRVVGEPNGAAVRLKSVTQFPSQGVRNPETRITNYRTEYMHTTRIGMVSYRGYTFEYDWEMLPGIWTFELWDGDRKLIEQRFRVFKP